MFLPWTCDSQLSSPNLALVVFFFFHSLLRIFHRLKVSILMKSYSLTAPVVDDNFGVKSEDTVRIRPKILSSLFFSENLRVLHLSLCSFLMIVKENSLLPTKE